MTENSSTKPQTTVIIPTLNRSDFVIRYLRYLRDVGFGGCLCVGDSSDAWHVERTRQAIEQLGISFSLVYKEYPGWNHVDVIRDLLSEVSTPYVMWVGDDDLFVPRTLEVCVQFLEQEPTYSAACGMVVLFALASKGVHGPVAWTEPASLRSIDADRAGDRLTNLFKHFVVVSFSVSRTEQFRQRWVSSPRFSDRALGAEILPCSLVVAQGKVKQLDRLLAARHVLHRRYNLPDLVKTMATSEGRISYEIYRDIVAEEIARQDRISMDQAKRIVESAFQGRVAGTLDRKAKTQLVKRMRQSIGRLPGFRKMWQKMQTALPGRTAEFSLRALLQPSSHYHDDFMPIYRTVTTLPQDGLVDGAATYVRQRIGSES